MFCACFLLIVLAGSSLSSALPHIFAQSDAASQELQQSIDAQRAAKNSGDPIQVAATSGKLADQLTQQITKATAALSEPNLSSASTAALKSRQQQLSQLLSSTYNDWGTAEALQRQYPQALSHFQQGEKWNPDTPGLMRNLGTAAFLLQNYPESVRALTSAVEQASDDQHLRLMLAMSLFTIEKFPEAADNFSKIGDLAMQDTRSAYAWAFSLARSNQQPQANQIADNLAARELPPDVRMLVCQLYNLTENYEHAVPCFRKLAEENPSMSRVHFEIGATLVHLDRPADAIPELRAELKLNPQDIDTQYYLAFALLETSQKAEALTLLQTVIAEKPDHAQAQYHFGKAMLEDGKTQEAIQHLEIAARLEPSLDYVHYQLQIAYRRVGRNDDANRELTIYKQLKAEHRNAGSHEDAP